MNRFPDLEFLRSAYGLLPDPGDRDPGTATWMPADPGGASGRAWRSCTCSTARKKTCRHLRRLERMLAGLREKRDGEAGERLAQGFWGRLGELLLQGDAVAGRRVLHTTLEVPGTRHHVFVSPDGRELARWLGDPAAGARLLERSGAPVGERGRHADRSALLHKLGLIAGTETERALNKAGHRSHRQTREESFWGRLVYHCFRELGEGTGSFHPAIEEESGEFTLTHHDADDRPAVRIVVPRSQVRAVLALLTEAFGEQAGLSIHPIPLRSIFKVDRTTQLDVEVRPAIELLQASGERRFFERADLARHTYGSLVYVPELGLLAELEREGRERTFRAPVAMKLTRSQVPRFLERHRSDIREGSVVLAKSLEPLQPLDGPDRVSISVGRSSAGGPGWYELSVTYGFGSRDVSLGELLRARSRGQAFADTAAGWVDLQAPFFRRLGPLLDRGQADDDSSGTGDATRLRPAEVLRLALAGSRPVEISGRGADARRLRRLVALQPTAPCPDLQGLRTPLRAYQKLGLDWCRFLFEHGLGGLLCDDMGLGKTHQAMALMIWLREHAEVTAPFLVVCPTTVISHWEDKLRRHAPGLRARVYHGAGREALDPAEADLLVTSYGVLRNDVGRLAEVPFALAVFDEIQHLKNRETRSYRAAERLSASMKLGLTGTPIENALGELKALLDLVLPGYLGTGAGFRRDYADPIENGADGGRLEELRRVIEPFVLRRVKSAVLDELPEKIEDLRVCRLSDDQVKLYRDALATRGRSIVERLRSGPEEEIPYLHVFALLTVLKQICAHPALVLGTGAPEQAERLASGKWELFQELLFESLDSGQKVVVFTQFLGMIRMMERLLDGLEVGRVTLTGASRDRGALIRRFHEDPDCRVFLGSLKAGGTGIDLVAASVVIHYDRWWTAAREDQATDRAHRIGQTRGLQVFKLVTEGTLEERISAIIERKRELMDSVVRPDDPKLSKQFTREELLELLRPPEGIDS